MATERIYRVVYIETSRDEDDIRSIFAKCGHICNVYPSKVGDRHKSVHFFLEFAQQASVKRARALQLRNVKVFAISYYPQLIEQFTLLTPSTEKHASASTNTPATGPNRSPLCPWSTEKSYPKAWSSHKIRKPTRFQPTNAGGLSSASGQGQHNKENVAARVHHATATPPFFAPSSLDGPGISTSTSASTAPSALSEGSVIVKSEPDTDPNPACPVPPLGSTTRSSSVVLNVCGRSFEYPLDQLVEDPTGVITVLTEVAAHALERDKWMVVAGHYRGKGNVGAALAVTTAMIEVMMSPSVGLSEAELKPAFLMVASCHTDLSKSAPKNEAKRHTATAQEYLQKVYGIALPKDFGQPATVTSPTTGRREYLANATNALGPITPGHGPAEADRRLRTLEREVQSLRDRHNNNVTHLEKSRETKRQLESELLDERSVRRKVERELEDAMHQLTSVRRAEKYAIDQCKREVDNRRRIEERAGSLREEVNDLKRELDGKNKELSEKDRRTNEVFARLGTMFMKASYGELDLSAVTWNLLSVGPSSMPPPPITPRRPRTASAASRNERGEESTFTT